MVRLNHVTTCEVPNDWAWVPLRGMVTESGVSVNGHEHH